jgi:phosphoethanolamine N-methyltransferase
MSQNTKEPEYNKNFTDLLEIMWGENFLSPGGPQLIDYMLRGVDLNNKKMLDIGCGLAGPALYLARQHKVEIVGIDVDADLIDEAQDRINSANHLNGKVTALFSKPEAALPFKNNTFDLVFGKESWLHIKNKAKFFREIFRVLKPQGQLINLDWMHTSSNYNEDMKKFVVADGLTFHFITPDEYETILHTAGFSQIKLTDTSHITLAETKKDCDFLTNSVASKVIHHFGEIYYAASLASWQLQEKVFAAGEMKSGLITARK